MRSIFRGGFLKYNFYYDESEHSSSIGFDTVTAENFYDNFITIIVGWKAENEQEIQERYYSFERKYIDRHPYGELKSDTIKNKQVRYGFASTAKGNVGFFDDYLSLFTNDVYVYVSTFSKVEYIVNQLFKDYKNSLLIDMDMMRYSIIKSLVIYKPSELVDAIYNNPHNIEPIDCVDWDYTPPFVGFRRFLDENSISDYSLIIDREGEHQKTVLAAKSVGLKNVDDEKSDNHFGIRMADMLAGMLGKLMKSLCKAIHPSNPDVIEKTVLSTEWFQLSEAQLVLYKKLYYMICELNNSWYKSFAGTYADDLVCINALLNFMNHFKNAEEIKNDIVMQGEYFNACACEALEQDYQRKRNKLPVEPIPSSQTKKNYYLNQRGAKVYYDIHKQPVLLIPNGSIKYNVLSVGFEKNMVPLVTIEEHGLPVCYRIPMQLSEWAFTVVAMANMGSKLFPSEVVFTQRQGKYRADIL